MKTKAFAWFSLAALFTLSPLLTAAEQPDEVSKVIREELRYVFPGSIVQISAVNRNAVDNNLSLNLVKAKIRGVDEERIYIAPVDNNGTDSIAFDDILRIDTIGLSRKTKLMSLSVGSILSGYVFYRMAEHHKLFERSYSVRKRSAWCFSLLVVSIPITVAVQIPLLGSSPKNIYSKKIL